MRRLLVKRMRGQSSQTLGFHLRCGGCDSSGTGEFRCCALAIFTESFGCRAHRRVVAAALQVNLIRVLDGRGDSAVPIFAKFETAREGAHVPAEQHIQAMSGVRTLPAAGVRSGCWIDRCSPKHKGCECCNVENWACGACNAKCG